MFLSLKILILTNMMTTLKTWVEPYIIKLYPVYTIVMRSACYVKTLLSYM
ncbi:hypothetical protein J4526_06830 [Desulfurococcaceae archaeon MEX13E-LK6-19]|nr:hypothetical protein J4526_06830 [Desulfurococcaceae archaeon MEX13E-LK6-19]